MISDGADRMPMPVDEALSESQRLAVERIADGPRGAIIGPFIPLLRNPELMTRVQLVGEYLRFESGLDADLRELVILQIARHWDQQFEWGFHHPLALKAGLPEAVVNEVAAHCRPSSGRPEVIVVWDLIDELLRTNAVSDSAYAEALRLLGENAIIDIVTTAGYYSTLAMVMNVARTPAPAGAPRLPEVR